MNWQALDEWSKERSVDVFAPGGLVHPIHGKSSLTLHDKELA